MTRVGWLVDWTDTPGGAEFTQAEFRAAAPQEVRWGRAQSKNRYLTVPLEVVDCRSGEIDDGCDLYVIQNCVRYTLDDLRELEGKPIYKYWHDVGPWLGDGVREWIDEHATAICCSPIQAEYMGLDDAVCIPPPVDLGRFEAAAGRVNGDRSGAVSIGSWRNYGKAPHKAAEWAKGNNGSSEIDFFGGGPWAPHGSREVPYAHIPDLLASYETFVFLPTVLEPFGRLVAEAWAAGCQVVTNNLVGARWWIENDPAALETSAERFWEVVCR